MAFGFSSSRIQYTGYVDMVRSAPGLTACCWIYPTSFAASGAPLAQWESAVNISAFTLQLNNATQQRLRLNIGGANQELLASNHTFVLNAWQHFAMTWDGATLRSWRNGVVGATTAAISGTLAPGVTTEPCIGARVFGGSDLFAGWVAEAAVWSVALQREDMERLALGFRPNTLTARPAFYADLAGSQRERMRGTIPTAQIGTVADQPHPPEVTRWRITPNHVLRRYGIPAPPPPVVTTTPAISGGRIIPGLRQLGGAQSVADPGRVGGARLVSGTGIGGAKVIS